MKSYIVYFAALFLLIFGCKKAPQYILEIFEGKSADTEKNTATKRITGDVSGDWYAHTKAATYIDKPNYFAVVLSTFEENGFQRESVSFEPIPLSTGMYKISKNTHDTILSSLYGRLTHDGDVLSAYYLPIQGYDSWIEIMELDTITNICKGRFSVGYKKDESSDESPYPPEVYFENGKFEVIIDR